MGESDGALEEERVANIMATSGQFWQNVRLYGRVFDGITRIGQKTLKTLKGH